MPKLSILLLFLPFLSAAQTDHTVLLYSHMLESDAAPQFSEFSNRNGAFIPGKGWEATSNSSQLYIKLPENLPDEGTFIIDVTNFDPVHQNQDDKQQIINLYSQNNGSKAIFHTDGSWWNIRTGYPYSSGAGMAGFKFLAAPRGIDTRDEERCIEYKSDWDVDHTYEFKVVWTITTISCYLDGVLLSELPFQGQVQAFQYIFIGTDNVYTAQPGPIYSNLRIYSSETAIIETEIAFSDVTTAYKVDGYSDSGYGHGVSFTDVDDDGFTDLLVSNAIRDQALPDILYMNQGGDWFSEQAAQRGTQDEGLTHSITSGDIDNDGDLDLFFSDMPVYEDKHGGYGRNALYQNNGSGHFTNVSSWGISDEENDSRGAIMLDINNDGWLDIYAVNWGEPCEMYLNEGNGHMRRIDRGANGPAGDASSKQGVTAADFDNDGDIDIYVCRREAANWLFVNDGSGHFSERGDEYDVDYGGRSHGATFADVDNDGDLDLFVVNYAYPSSDLPLMGIFINNGDGSFTDKTKDYNIRVSGYSVAFGDVDNDADLDMLLAYNDDKDPGAVPRLLINNGAGQFTRITCGVEVPTHDPRGLGYGDIDNDGDIDFYIACKRGHNFLLKNDYEGANNYIDVLCIGPQGDYGGFGSKVTVYEPGHLGDTEHILGYQESVSNYAYLCQNQTALHFGLRDFTTCDIRIVLTDGKNYDYQNVAANQVFEMDQQEQESFSLVRVSGDNQSGEPGAQLAAPFVVRVQNQDGADVDNIHVTFTPQNGGSMIDPTVVTDAEGFARGVFVLGDAEGDYIVIASSTAVSSTVTFHASAVSAHNNITIFKNYGDEQIGVVGQTLDSPVVVKAVDEQGRAVAHIAVTFIARDGFIGGDSTIIDTTDNEGKARAIWTLGVNSGVQHLAAKYDTTELEFTATALADEPTILEKLAPADTLYQAGKSYPFRCAAKDRYGNPTPEVEVIFSIIKGNGLVNGDSVAAVITDSSGVADAFWRLGLNHTWRNLLRAEIADTPDAALVEFVLDSIAPPLLDKSTITANKDTVAADGIDKAHLLILLKDELGQPLPDYSVNLEVTGSGNLLTLGSEKSDSSGALHAILKSTAPEEKIISAAVAGVGNVRDTAIIHFITPPLDQMYLVQVSGDSQIAVVGQTLPEPLVVQVINSQEMPLAGEKVVFEVKNSLGRLGGGWKQIVASNDSGYAEINLILGEKAGEWNHHVVSYLEADSAGVEFWATALADSAVALTKLTPDSLTALPGDTLSFGVRLADRYGNPIKDASVIYYSSIEETFLADMPLLTNASGQAEVKMIVGGQVGVHTIWAKSGNDSTGFIIFVVQKPEHLVPVSADTIVFENLNSKTELVVQCLDPKNNPMPGIAVEFQTVQGRGHFQGDSLVFSDSSGYAFASWQPADMLSVAVIKAASPHDSLYFYLRPKLISAVQDDALPKDFLLGDNYPNPFNPATTIPFKLPYPEFVRLQVFDLNGRLVRTLARGKMAAGEHIVVFDAHDENGESVPSGIYFYQLKAGNFRAVKRLLLVK